MRYFFCLILLVFSNIFVFSEEINILNIKLSKFEKELFLKGEQKDKMLAILKKEDNESKRPVILYDLVNDSLEKIIKVEKEQYVKKEQNLKSFLNNDQYNKFESIKMNTVQDKFTLYLSKGLEFDNRQTLILNTFVPLIIKKMNAAKGNSVYYEPSQDRVKKILEMFAVLEQETIKVLTLSQKKLYDANRKKIFQYLIKEILGFEEKDEVKERSNKSKQMPTGIAF